MKRLVLTTYTYPYFTEDLFLTAEQEFFPKDIPIDAVPWGFGPGKTSVVPGVPGNVEPVPLVWKKMPIPTRIRYLVRTLFLPEFLRDVRRLKKEGRLNRRSFAKSLSWVSRGEWEFRSLEKHYRSELQSEPHELVFYSFWFDQSAYAISRLRDKYGCHAVARGNGGDIFEERISYGRLPMRVYTLSHLDFISVCSKDGQRYLKEKYRVGDIRQAYLGTVDHGERPVEKPASGQPFVIVSCGNVIPLKRIELTAESLGNLSYDGVVRWVHFGDGVNMPVVKERIEKLPSNISVELMGRVPHDEVMRWYCENDAHLFISASTTETTPVSIMEALSFGIPCLVTDAGGSSEAVDDTCGRCVPIELTAAKLGAHISDFIDMSAEQYAELRRNARLRWEQNFSADRNYRPFDNTLASL